MAIKMIYLCPIILLLVRDTYQLNYIQRQIKDALVSSTSTLNPKHKIQMADYIKEIIFKIPMNDTLTKMVTEVIDEFKSESNSGHILDSSLIEMEKMWINTVAYNLEEDMSLEELNRSMKVIGEDEQSSKMSAARYLTIYLEHKARNITDKLTQYSDKVMEDITANTVKVISK